VCRTVGAVIEWRLSPDDVARIRFAFSPLLELVLSLIVLRAPARHSLHLPWIRQTRPRLVGLDLTDVFALVPVSGITADFLSPPPSTPLPDLADELDLVRNTPPERILADLTDVPDLPPDLTNRFHTDPHTAVTRVVDTLQTYWDIALAPHWPRIKTLLEADTLWRARQLAAGGAHALFHDLHPTITWHGDRLTVTDPWSHTGTPSGAGLLLVPSAMAWPTVRKMVHPYQPLIAYPARAIGTLWETGHRPPAHALADLLGPTRAQLLTLLAEPDTTTALARRLHLTPSAISQHLTVLHANGLITRTRTGRTVLYHRTTRGDTLTTPN
jgi:DNA-binding transcriptional ArsR family regulator